MTDMMEWFVDHRASMKLQDTDYFNSYHYEAYINPVNANFTQQDVIVTGARVWWRVTCKYYCTYVYVRYWFRMNRYILLSVENSQLLPKTSYSDIYVILMQDTSSDGIQTADCDYNW